jgi:hydroxylaminobenzene mutase
MRLVQGQARARRPRVAFWTVLYSAYVNWLSTTLAALWGTAALSPLTGMSHPAKPWQEIVVTVGLLSVGLALLAGTILILWGLRRGKSAA